jgi:AAA domain
VTPPHPSERPRADPQAEAAEKPVRAVVVASAQSMTMRPPKWLYDRRIPTDAISLLAGREGIGKSTIAFDIVARVTRGELPGRYAGTPRSVGVVASEDSWESVILPRLIAARADLARVFRIEARTEENRIETISAPADLVDLARVCAEHDVVLLILDPVMSVIHGALDTHKDREVRQALDPLAAVQPRVQAPLGAGAFRVGLDMNTLLTNVALAFDRRALRCFHRTIPPGLYCGFNRQRLARSHGAELPASTAARMCSNSCRSPRARARRPSHMRTKPVRRATQRPSHDHITPPPPRAARTPRRCAASASRGPARTTRCPA